MKLSDIVGFGFHYLAFFEGYDGDAIKATIGSVFSALRPNLRACMRALHENLTRLCGCAHVNPAAA